MRDKAILKAILTQSLQGEAGSGDLLSVLGLGRKELRERLVRLKERGLIRLEDSKALLAPKGRRLLKVVFIGGTFEIIHPGHLSTIEQARNLGDLLVVVVARDNTVRRRKGRDPIVPEGERRRVVSAIRLVDVAILGSETNIYDTLEKVQPDVVALGYDQYHGEGEIAREARSRGLKLSVVRLNSPIPTLKTSKILSEL